MRTGVFVALFCFPLLAVAGSRWHKTEARSSDPAGGAVALFHTNEAALRTELAPASGDPNSALIIDLPLADGTTRLFRVWSSGLLPQELAAKYPSIKTYSAEAVDNPNITARLDFTVYGFHALVFDGINISLVDPADGNHSGQYIAHYKKDERRQSGNRMVCAVGPAPAHANSNMDVTRKSAFRTDNGTQLRTYRLALACDHQYAQTVTGNSGPTIEQVLSKMTTTMNRVNGVYEREMAITMVFVAKEDTLIFPADNSVNGLDPFSAIDASASPCLFINQNLCDTRIGDAYYDIGHVFTTGAGGLSQIGVVCQSGYKAESVTGQPQPQGDGFDIDYVAHEMGHEYGADHPFNDGSNGSCGGGNINAPTAYEPGSGSTIMAYAGICAPDDLQPHSDAYFHAVSLAQIQFYTVDGMGNDCPVHAPTGNKTTGIAPFTASYTIPYLTPFELIAPIAADSVADTATTYCWEQWNLGDVGASLSETHYAGPIFRSYFPASSPTRTFPNTTMILADSLSNAGTEDAEGEKVPDVARYLTFRLTVRDIYNGVGCFLTPDDTIHLDVINTGSGFAVTSQPTSGNAYLGLTPMDVTWNVAGTNADPINDQSVDIYMSGDAGHTWPYYVGNFHNNGLATIILPNPDTNITYARFKVKGHGNVFFNVNKGNFAVEHNFSTLAPSDIEVYPSPVRDVLHIYTGSKGLLRYEVYNSVGQQAATGIADAEEGLPVYYLATGMYFIRFFDEFGTKTVKKFVVD